MQKFITKENIWLKSRKVIDVMNLRIQYTGNSSELNEIEMEKLSKASYLDVYVCISKVEV